MNWESNQPSVKRWLRYRERVTKPKPKSYVYILKSDDLYKIGYSAKPKQRFQNIKNVIPNEVEMLGCRECNSAQKVESYFHEYFEDKRVKGEWFDLEVDDVVYFFNVNLVDIDSDGSHRWFVYDKDWRKP